MGGSSAAARFPFPQRFETAHCQLPATARPSDVTAAYEHWKKTLLTSDGAGGHLRVRRPNSKGAVVNSTVSEGIAYGMLIAVAMNDRVTFDELWKYSQLHLNANGLMNWYIDPTGTRALGEGAATDSDEDIAFALVLADRQWGGRGSLNEDYLTLAKRQIDRVWKSEVEHGTQDVLKPGDLWGGAQLTNPSYFAPAYYRTFARISGEQGWLRVVDSSYDIIEACLNAKSGNGSNGLVPAWCTAAGDPTHNPQHFQFDSCRTPFRIAQDYCYYGEPRARAYLEKITSFYAGIGLANLVDGFELNGKPRPEFSVNGTRAAAFVGPAGVGALFDPAHSEFVEGAYSDLITPGALQVGDAAYTNAGSIYYNTSWRVLSLLMLNGALYDYTLLDAP
jgi:endo-1,4-beta-D-glucanase Y